MVYFHGIDVSEEINVNKIIIIKQANPKSVIFVTIDIFYIRVLSFNQMSVIDDMIY